MALLAGVLGGCSVADRLVYKIDINQGNYIVDEDVNKLRFGMSREQVRFVLGSPMLVESHDPNTWFYIYHQQPGHDDIVQRNLIVLFDEQGLLTHIDGDYAPGEQFYTPIG
nr:outer membrane protein assembly factor BamE [Thaumasiovibrio subtropicus]